MKYNYRLYRNIKNMNIDDFRRRFTESRLYDPIVLECYLADAYAELFNK